MCRCSRCARPARERVPVRSEFSDVVCKACGACTPLPVVLQVVRFVHAQTQPSAFQGPTYPAASEQLHVRGVRQRPAAIHSGPRLV